MKIKKPFYTFSYLSILIILLIGSCKNDGVNGDDTTPALDCVVAENFFTDIKNIVDEAGFRNGAFNGILNDTSIIVSYDTLNHTNPDTITINFGISPVICSDGRSRKGEIIAIYNGHYSDTSKTHAITLSNYYVDNSLITGTISDSYKGWNTTGHQSFNDTITGKIMYPRGTVVTFNATNKLQFIAGDSTTIWSNHKMTIAGNTYGYASDGTGFSTYISTPLLRNFASGCRKYLVQGVIQVAETNLPYTSIDLGTATCDDLITVSVNGNTYVLHTN